MLDSIDFIRADKSLSKFVDGGDSPLDDGRLISTSRVQAVGVGRSARSPVFGAGVIVAASV